MNQLKLQATVSRQENVIAGKVYLSVQLLLDPDPAFDGPQVVVLVGLTLAAFDSFKAGDKVPVTIG